MLLGLWTFTTSDPVQRKLPFPVHHRLALYGDQTFNELTTQGPFGHAECAKGRWKKVGPGKIRLEYGDGTERSVDLHEFENVFVARDNELKD